MNPGDMPAYPTLGDAYMQVADGSWQPKSHYGMEGASGMTLRDAFAIAAMQGIVANSQFFGPLFQQSPEVAADFAWKMADAMLRARSAAAAGGEQS